MDFILRWLLRMVLCLTALAAPSLAFAAPPTDGCSMLTPAQIEKVLGQPFGVPTETKAPPAYGGQPWGSHCEYSSQKTTRAHVIFIAYVDASDSDAKQTFEKLSAWYSPNSKVLVGDEAYLDRQHAIHVLKGKVRYYVSISPDNEKQTIGLATAIAGRI